MLPTRSIALAMPFFATALALLEGCASHAYKTGAAAPSYGLPTPREASVPPSSVPVTATGSYATDESLRAGPVSEEVSVSAGSTDEPTPAPPPMEMKAAPSSAGEDVYVAGDGGGGGGGGNTSYAPYAYTAAPTTAAVPQEMFDIEARMTLVVDKVTDSAQQMRDLARTFGANVVSDQVTSETGYAGEANFEIRVPSEKIDQFLAAVSAVGKVYARDVKARDVGKEYHDDVLLLENLEAAMKRYEDILQKAKDVQETLQVENELTRLRGEISRVKGDMQWMKDRTARSTVYVRIVPVTPESDLPPPEPTGKFFPGIRGSQLEDFRGEGLKQGYVGLGIGLQFGREFSMDFDFLRKSGGGSFGDGLDGFIATLGGDIYSELLGGGRRRFLNPYLGLRVGYSRLAAKNDLVLGGDLGIEIVRTKFLVVDTQFRLLGFVGNSDGAHVGAQSTLGINFAF